MLSKQIVREKLKFTLPSMMAGRSTRHEEERRLRRIALWWSMSCIEPIGLNGTGGEMTGRGTESAKERQSFRKVVNEHGPAFFELYLMV